MKRWAKGIALVHPSCCVGLRREDGVSLFREFGSQFGAGCQTRLYNGGNSHHGKGKGHSWPAHHRTGGEYCCADDRTCARQSDPGGLQLRRIERFSESVERPTGGTGAT